jgi:hypothetical protein
MSWVNDMASSLGIPAGAATLAVAMYAACAAAAVNLWRDDLSIIVKSDGSRCRGCAT